MMAFSRVRLILGGMACFAAATSPPVQPGVSCTTTTICSTQTPSPGCQGPNFPQRPPFGPEFPWNQQPVTGQHPGQHPGRQPGRQPGQQPIQRPGQFNPGQYIPGQYIPGQYIPGQFDPGHFTPGHFTPGQYIPGHFDPGHFTPGDFTPGQQPGFDNQSPEQGHPSPECPPCSCEPHRPEEPTPNFPEEEPLPQCKAIAQDWQRFQVHWSDTHPKPGDPEPILITTDWEYPTILTVTDDEARLEQYAISLDFSNTPLGLTSEPANPEGFGKDDCGNDAEDCMKRGWSYGSFNIPAGEHTIEIAWRGADKYWENMQTFNYGSGQYKFERAVPCASPADFSRGDM